MLKGLHPKGVRETQRRQKTPDALRKSAVEALHRPVKLRRVWRGRGMLDSFASKPRVKVTQKIFTALFAFKPLNLVPSETLKF